MTQMNMKSSPQPNCLKREMSFPHLQKVMMHIVKQPRNWSRSRVLDQCLFPRLVSKNDAIQLGFCITEFIKSIRTQILVL